MSDITSDVFDFIRHYIEEHGIAPSQREIARGCLIAPSSVVRHLDLLEARGLIKRVPHAARGIIVLSTEGQDE